MTAAEAMKALDAIVAERRPESQYTAAAALYAAAHAGILRVPIPLGTLYGWVLKWATLPSVRGVR